MRTPSLYTALTFTSLALVNAQWPVDGQSAMIRELEHIALDGAPHNLKSLISPCSQYIDSSTGSANPTLGRQTAAEWIRTTFHDFITGNNVFTFPYTGGVDASIGFEVTRSENVGSAFNDALINFSYFMNAKVSMADLIALGTVLAAGHCGGTPVRFRGGRTDATVAGPTGVPQPQQDLQTQLTMFSNVGFNGDDTIALTACGHTLGGVHKKDFPDVITQSTGLDGSDGRVAFDTSVNNFDTNVATEFVKGTGSKGGPLVTTTNKTMQSDLRLYNSDNKATITRMGQSQDYFNTQCSSLFQRMIETVPGGVRFTQFIDPSTTTNIKPYNVDLNMDWKGGMTLTGYLRYVEVSGAAKAPTTLTVQLVDRKGTVSTSVKATATKSAADSGTFLYGPTYSYKFQLTFPSTTGVGGISVGGTKFTLQDAMFVVPGMSSLSPAPPAFNTNPSLSATASYSANLTVAYYTTTPPASLSATYQYPVPQTGSVAPKIDSSTTAQLSQIGKIAGGYAIYSGKITKSLTGKQVYGLSVDVTASGQAPGSGGLGFYKVVKS